MNIKWWMCKPSKANAAIKVHGNENISHYSEPNKFKCVVKLTFDKILSAVSWSKCMCPFTILWKMIIINKLDKGNKYFAPTFFRHNFSFCLRQTFHQICNGVREMWDDRIFQSDKNVMLPPPGNRVINVART